MEAITVTEFRTRFGAILERTVEGEEFSITRRGKSVARFVPPEHDISSEEVEAAISGLREFEASHSLRGVTIFELIRDGRKW